MSALLIAMLIAVYTLQSLLTKKYSEYYPGDENMSSPVFTVVGGIIVAAVSYIFMGFHFEASWLTIVLGIINGITLFGYNTCIIKASNNGPYSILIVFMIAGSIILPALVTVIGFHEIISLGKWISIMVLLGGVYFTSKRSENIGFANKKLFWICCMGLAIFNGIYCSLLDIQQRLTSAQEKEEMIVITYLFAMLLSGVFLLVKQGKSAAAAFHQTKKSAIYLLLCSVIVALAINLLVFVLPLVNVTILYTFNNAGVFLASALISRFFFHEKMTMLNWVGCAAMCLALVGVSVL